MSDITLSKGVRQNLLSLQNTAELLGRTQERLSTGKKVNSALDNPVNFFTAAGLSARSNDLSRLLDSVGNAMQTIQAADKGITAITKLIESAQATARQALSSAQPAATYDLSVTGTAAIAADDPAVATSANDVATVLGAATASNVATFELDLSDLTGLTDEDTITITFGGTSITLEFDDDADIAGGAGVTGFTDLASAVAALENVFGAGNVSEDTGVITIKGTDYTTDFSMSGDASLTGLGDASNTANLGDTLTVTVGGQTTTFYYVADVATDGAEGTFAFSDLSEITAAFTAADIGVAADDDGSGNLELTGTGSFTVGGDLAAALDFGGTSFSPTNAELGALTGTLTIAVTGQGNQTITFGGAGVTNREQLLAELNGLTGITATINGDDQIEFTSTANVSLTLSGDADVMAALGLEDVDGEAQAATATVAAPSESRTTAQSAYNELLVQITQLARDASFNGINLLNSDNLTVTFNEDGSSTLTIQGVDFTAEGLGLTAQAGDAFQSNAGINAAIAELDAATRTLRAQASTFGANLSIVQTRQDFTKNMINVLQVGADNLVLADTNEEGANMLALNTRQQLSTVALSMAAQADQNVLRLF